MEIEIIDNSSLNEYVKIWKWSDWDSVTYGDYVMELDVIAFGIRDNGRPEGIIMAEMSENFAEIKLLNYNSQEALKELMKAFSDYCHSFDKKKLKYSLKISESDQEVMKNIMTYNGWNEPVIKNKIFGIKKDEVMLSQRTKGHLPKGRVISFFDTTIKQRFEMAKKLSENSVFYRMEAPIEELSVAYIEEDVINGFVLSEYRNGELFIEMDRMTAEPLAVVSLITELSEMAYARDIRKVFIIINTDFGEQLIKNLCIKQVFSTEIIISGE